MNAAPTGALWLAGQREQGGGDAFSAVDAATGSNLEPQIHSIDGPQLEKMCQSAHEAFLVFRKTDAGRRAALLDMMAEELEHDTQQIVSRAMLETALPQARLRGEMSRTTNQLRLFASYLRKGFGHNARVSSALPQRQPLPRSDIRQMRVGLGPVVVFGASNFPLAFSVAGGDTASALAAGCPVIVKAHSAHPGTSELTANAVARAVERSQLPAGIFNLVFASDYQAGVALVKHPAIAAVGFTGSRSGGLALMKAASYRPVPIPVFAEMSSINPVVLLPNALRARGASIAEGFVNSMVLGAGQFCTNPGLVLAVDTPELREFEAASAMHLKAIGAQNMLTEGIRSAFIDQIDALADADAQLLAQGLSGEGKQAQASLFACSDTAFASNPVLAEEVFGACSLIVRCQSSESLLTLIDSLEGQLTATLHLDDGDEHFARAAMDKLELRVGRILCNGYPTGVEVCDAMVHGGPFPATSDGVSTSVGTAAIERFQRAVCYQDVPDALLPDALKRDNPTGIDQQVDRL